MHMENSIKLSHHLIVVLPNEIQGNFGRLRLLFVLFGGGGKIVGAGVDVWARLLLSVLNLIILAFGFIFF